MKRFLIILMAFAFLGFILYSASDNSISVETVNPDGVKSETNINVKFTENDDDFSLCPPLCSEQEQIVIDELKEVIAKQLPLEEEEKEIDRLLQAYKENNTTGTLKPFEIILTSSIVDDESLFDSVADTSVQNEADIITTITKIDSDGNESTLTNKNTLDLVLSQFSVITDPVTGSDFDVGTISIDLVVKENVEGNVKKVSGKLFTLINGEHIRPNGIPLTKKSVNENNDTILIDITEPSSILLSLKNSIPRFVDGENIISYEIQDFIVTFDNGVQFVLLDRTELASVKLLFNKPLHDVLIQQQEQRERIQQEIEERQGRLLEQQELEQLKKEIELQQEKDRLALEEEQMLEQQRLDEIEKDLLVAKTKLQEEKAKIDALRAKLEAEEDINRQIAEGKLYEVRNADGERVKVVTTDGSVSACGGSWKMHRSGGIGRSDIYQRQLPPSFKLTVFELDKNGEPFVPFGTDMNDVETYRSRIDVNECARVTDLPKTKVGLLVESTETNESFTIIHKDNNGDYVGNQLYKTDINHETLECWSAYGYDYYTQVNGRTVTDGQVSVPYTCIDKNEITETIPDMARMMYKNECKNDNYPNLGKLRIFDVRCR